MRIPLTKTRVKALATAMDNLGMTQAELARKTGVLRAKVKRVLRREVLTIEPELLARIEVALEISKEGTSRALIEARAQETVRQAVVQMLRSMLGDRVKRIVIDNGLGDLTLRELLEIDS